MKESLLHGMVLMGRDTESLLPVSWVIFTLAVSSLVLQDVGWYTCTGTITGDNGVEITGSNNHYIGTIRK